MIQKTNNKILTYRILQLATCIIAWIILSIIFIQAGENPLAAAAVVAGAVAGAVAAAAAVAVAAAVAAGVCIIAILIIAFLQFKIEEMKEKTTW